MVYSFVVQQLKFLAGLTLNTLKYLKARTPKKYLKK